MRVSPLDRKSNRLGLGATVIALVVLGAACLSLERANGSSCIKGEDCSSGYCNALVCSALPPTVGTLGPTATDAGNDSGAAPSDAGADTGSVAHPDSGLDSAAAAPDAGADTGAAGAPDATSPVGDSGVDSTADGSGAGSNDAAGDGSSDAAIDADKPG